MSSLVEFVPSGNRYRTYFEAFFGGGAVYFAVQPKRAVLSDVNADLINCYQLVRKKPKSVASLLRRYVRKDSASFFYRVRDRSNGMTSLAARAAKFIYLNKAAFNGIYRVNKQGKFNVPYGPSENGPAVPEREDLLAASKCLKQASLIAGDFEKVLRRARRGDFVYFDPPYPPRSDTAYFVHYSRDRFDWNEQIRVAKVFRRLARRGCLVMLSNADQKRVVSLYRGFRFHRLGATRWLGSNGDRFRVREIVVTNYDPSEVQIGDDRLLAENRPKGGKPSRVNDRKAGSAVGRRTARRSVAVQHGITGHRCGSGEKEHQTQDSDLGTRRKWGRDLSKTVRGTRTANPTGSRGPLLRRHLDAGRFGAQRIESSNRRIYSGAGI
ncbi:MAG: Dam family site-specific DNA-(adenine-N6)-methyltransferase [Acidobacteria bacterium]|nr:Dam family site-specific DNA-(adenine-N6)-methyltransferase [Acidobacteriota bacterium]